jgi:serine/threonine protein kinase
MGTVYLALHPIMGRKAAVKVLKPELARDESLVTRFFNEARAANAIRHPNIIDIIDVGLLPEDNVPYMLMEFLEGESLAARLERARPLPVDMAVEVAMQTASALAAAHSKGIVHRDLKPDNLFLVPDEMVEGGERVKVLDFGIAKLRDDMRGSSMKTRTGAIMGTAAYMSPEQCQGLIERIDHRTDIYALGIIMYEMLCGAPPFISEGFGDIIIMHVMREPESPQLRNPLIPDAVAAAMLCALAKSPDHRFQSMSEFQAALRAHAGAHSTPMQGVPYARTTAILDEQATPPPRTPSQLAFERTMATPPPVLLRPGSVPPSSHPAYREPTGGGAKQATTTFRTASGEVSDTTLGSSGKRKTAIAIGAIVGLAAIGLGATVLITRPSDPPADKSTSAVSQPPPSHELEKPFVPPTPPPPPPLPPPPPVVHEEAPTPRHVEEPRRGKKTVTSRSKKSTDKPSERPAAPPPPDDSESGGAKNTERW